MCDRNFIVAGLSHQDSMPLYDSFDELLRGHVGHRLDGSSWIIAHIGRKLATADDVRAVAFVRLAVYVNNGSLRVLSHPCNTDLVGGKVVERCQRLLPRISKALAMRRLIVRWNSTERLSSSRQSCVIRIAGWPKRSLTLGSRSIRRDSDG
jgi:hypothetical protein